MTFKLIKSSERNFQCFVVNSTRYSVLLCCDSSYTETQGCLGVTHCDMTYLKYLLWIRTLILIHKSSDTIFENEQKTVPHRSMCIQLHTLSKKKSAITVTLYVLNVRHSANDTLTHSQIHTD